MPEQLEEVIYEGRKRKQYLLLMQEQYSPTSPSQGFQQSTITDHFSPRSGSPTIILSKRTKSNTVERTSKQLTNIQPITEINMLDFGSVRGTIDLTDSSDDPFTQDDSKHPPIPGKPPLFKTRSAVRKITVKNLRTATNNNGQRYFDTMWKTLDTTLTAVFNKEKITTSMEVLYRGVENICRSDMAPQLFELLKTRLDDYVRGQLRPKIMDATREESEDTVKVVTVGWAQWGQQLSTVRSIFLYLDRSYLFPTPNLQPIEATGITMFKKHVVSDPSLEINLLNGIFCLFEQDRNNRGASSLNVGLLVSSVKMIAMLGLYSHSFEPRFMDFSRQHYSEVADRESQNYDLKGYIKECTEQLANEVERCERFRLNYQTKRELILVVEDEMIRKKLDILIATDRVCELLSKLDHDTLSLLYELMVRVGDVGNVLKSAWESYIITDGAKIVTDKEHIADMVPRLLDLKGNLDSIWNGPFRRNDILGFSLRESFTKFINERRTANAEYNNAKPAEMIAKYVDQLLRSGTNGLPPVAGRECTGTNGDDDGGLTYRLELVLELFRFIQGKDVFEAFYKNALSKRLLMGRSASVDAERLMLAKLKTECGSAFTHNLECMFKDMDLSRESVASFKTSKIGMAKSRNVELSVNILSQSAWPTYPETPLNIPTELAEHLEAFEKFYVTMHSGRKLTWRHGMSHCTVKADFLKGRKELVLGAFQAVVLLAFNDTPGNSVLTYDVLKMASGLPDEELKRTLQSLACGKIRTLTKSPKGKEVDTGDKFQINHNFTDPKFRVKVNQIQLKETKKENVETHERVTKDRQYETQAAIIRIMKSRRKIRHVELVQQTIEQTKNRGTLEISAIKENIEKLIDKDYMGREGDDHYIYIA